MCMMGAEALALLKSEISKVWKAVKKYLVYIIIIAALFWPMLAPFVISMLPTGVAAVMGPYLAAATYASYADILIAAAVRVTVAIAFCFLLDEEAAQSVVDWATNGVVEIVEAVAELVGDVAGAIGTGLFGENWLWWLVGGVATYAYLSSGRASRVVMAAPVTDDQAEEGSDTGLASGSDLNINVQEANYGY